MRSWAERCGRLPCDNGKTIVGRGPCAPPLECGGVSAAAHVGAALQKFIILFVGAGDSARPMMPEDFHKMSFRGAQRRGNPLSLCGECGAKGVRIATPVTSVTGSQ